ncbi:MAG: FlgD immunoglobulin-like domain containing protein, partial [Calditrichia bacterium]
TINNGGPLNIAAGGFLVLGRKSNSSVNGGYTADYQYASFALANGADEVILEASGTVIDSVAYDGGPNWPDPNGASMALINFQTDNNVGSNWTTSTTREPTYTGPTGDLGSPGTLGSDQSLPVSLILFNASAANGKVTLKWATASEQENVGFKILRATEESGEYWVRDSYENNPDLEGQFNSGSRHDYQFVDANVINGVTYWYKLVDVDVNGVQVEHGPLSATPHAVGNEITTITTRPAGKFELHQNYPNPFNPSTTLRFDIPAMTDEVTEVQMVVYNSQGQKVKTLFQGNLSAGTHELVWNGDSEDGTPVAAGMYYAVLRMNHLTQATKLLLIK